MIDILLPLEAKYYLWKPKKLPSNLVERGRRRKEDYIDVTRDPQMLRKRKPTNFTIMKSYDILSKLCELNFKLQNNLASKLK